MKLTNATVLITGASSGIGKEFARQLASQVREIILVARRYPVLQELKNSLAQNYPLLSIKIGAYDLTEENQRIKLIEWILNEKIPINLLINNAGIGDIGKFDESILEKNFEMIQLNITALIHLVHSLIPILKQNKPSGIINISSVAGFYPLPNRAVYAATKSFVNHFTRALEIENRDISIAHICPGPIPTNFFKNASRTHETSLVKSKREKRDFLSESVETLVTKSLTLFQQNRSCIIPHPVCKILKNISSLIPYWLLKKIL